MIIQSKYTKIFNSNSLTKVKYNELYDYAVYLRDYKNKLSKEVNSNLLFYLNMSKFSFLKYMRNKYNGEVSSNFDSQNIVQVFTTYQNKFDSIQKKLSFEKVIFKGFEYYKRNTKQYKKGDFKKVNIEKEQTKLSSCLTYLARYGNENTVSYINEQLKDKELDKKKREYYINILNYINKFGFDRLFSLSLQKRSRVIKHYSTHPIEFKSLSFGGRSRKKNIISYNKNYNSIINSFISLSFGDRKSLDIPVKFSKEYHGNMRDYKKNSHDYEYVITFNEKRKEIKVNICKNGDRYIPDNKTNFVGIDVNVKHNLFSLSNGDCIDYNRKLVNDFCKLSTEVVSLKKQNKDYIIGKRRQWKLDVLRNKMLKSNQQLISSMCKDLQSKGFNHIVMEELNNGFGRSYVKDVNNNDINFNRVVNFLNLSSLKGEVEHIGRKYDIVVSTVHSCYTSKQCSVCGCIADENRLSQEAFSCIECGYESNADFNASLNIRDRVSVTVLRSKLLKQVDSGSFVPKNVDRSKVKELLLSFRRSSAMSSKCNSIVV